MKVQELLEKITPENIILVANAHIEWYEKLLNSNSSNVRPSECLEYQRIWESIKDKGGIVSALIPAERTELIDAIFCGSYDKIFGLTGDEVDNLEDDDGE
jgi:hypothetical protein